MSDDLINASISTQTAWQNIEVATPQVKTTTIKDTVELYKAIENKESVSSLPGHPKLPVPASDADPTGMFQLGNLMQHFTGEILTAANSLPTIEDKFTDAAEAELANLSDEDLAGMGGGLPKEQVIKMVRFGVLYPDANLPPEIKSASAQILENATATAGTPPSPFVKIIGEKLVDISYSTLLKAEILNSGLPLEAQQQLLAAQDMPEFTAELSPSMQPILIKANKAAFLEVQTQYGVPNDWEIPRDPAGYEKGVSEAIEKSIGDSLHSLFVSGKLSRADFNDIRTMLYFPDASPPNAAKLAPILAEVKANAMTEAQSEWGFPSSYEPIASSREFDAILTGAFYSIATKAIASQTPALSAADQSRLTAALGSTDARASLSPELKVILSNIESASATKVQAQYSLPTKWTPNVEMLALAERSNTPSLQFAKAGIAMAFESVTNLKALATVTTSSDGGTAGVPTGGKLLNYLRMVSAALTSLQEMLFAASVTDSDISKMLNRIENDLNISRVDKQKKEIEEIKSKEAKMAALGPFKFLMVLVVGIIMAMTMGCMGAVLFAAFFLNSMIQNKGNVTKIDLMADFAKTVGQIGTAIGGKILGNILVVLSNVTVARIAPLVLVCDLMFGQGSMISSTLEALGMPKQISGYLTMGVQVIFMVVSIVVTWILSGGATWELAMAQIASFLGNITNRVVAQVLQVVIKVCDFLRNVLEKYAKACDLTSLLIRGLERIGEKATNAIAKALTAQENLEKAINAISTTGKELELAQKNTLAAKAGVESSEKIENALQTTLNNLRNAGNASAQQIDDVVADLEIARKNVLNAKELLTAVQEIEKEAVKASELAAKTMEEVAKEATGRWMKISQIAGYIPDIAQSGVEINNNILRGQIALIRGALDAYVVEVEAFIKILQSLVDKFLKALQELGKDLSALGNQMQDSWAKQGQAMTALSRAMGS